MNAEKICASLQYLPDDMIAEAVCATGRGAGWRKWILPVAAGLVLLMTLPFWRQTFAFQLPPATEVPPTAAPIEPPSDTEPGIELTEADLTRSVLAAYIPDLSDLGFNFSLASVGGMNLEHYQAHYHAVEGKMDFFVFLSPKVGVYHAWWVDTRNPAPSPSPYATPVFLAEQFNTSCIDYVKPDQLAKGNSQWQFVIKIEDGYVCYSLNVPTEEIAKEIFARIEELYR